MTIVEGPCPERPELLDGTIGEYHCPVCCCLVLAGVPHRPHEGYCSLPSYTELEYKDAVTEYAAAHAVLLDPSERPPVLPPDGLAWVWLAGAAEPHWVMRPVRYGRSPTPGLSSIT